MVVSWPKFTYNILGFRCTAILSLTSICLIKVLLNKAALLRMGTVIYNETILILIDIRKNYIKEREIRLDNTH
jgi:hypothetical protein